MEFFTSEKISSTTTKIAYLNNVYCYLVEGSEGAMLLDAGAGFGNLREYAEGLTQKPISVIVTHGHVDHVGCAALFDQVYLNEIDLELLERHDSEEGKWTYTSMVLKDRMEEGLREFLCEKRKKEFLPLYHGQTFSLGDVHLQILALPGHTKGGVCVLHEEERWILFGDMCSHSVYLWSEESTSVEEYLEHLLKLKRYEDKFDRVLLSHGNAIEDKAMLDGVIEVCKEILEGKDDAVPYTFRAVKELLIAKETNIGLNRADGGIGNVIYRKNKIFKGGI